MILVYVGIRAFQAESPLVITLESVQADRVYLREQIAALRKENREIRRARDELASQVWKLSDEVQHLREVVRDLEGQN